jgi:hypothetical protein
MTLRVAKLIVPAVFVLALAAAPGALATGGSSVPGVAATGGTGIGAPPPAPSTPSHPTVTGWEGKIINGIAYAPSYAPLRVRKAIWAGNKIRRKPYIWGGGHGAFAAAGYDCSGAVSYVLHAAGLLKTPFDSSDFMSWGHRGLGKWITVYTNPSHAFVQIAGIRLDTSAEGDPHPTKGSGPRWRPVMSSTGGFQARHPSSF